MPHTVTEDLARQPTVTVKKITPASVREFLRRSQGGSHADMRGVVEFFGGGGGGGGGASSSSGQAGYSDGGSGGGGGYQRHSPRSGGTAGSGSGSGSAPPPDTGLLLELLEFCLSDCDPPAGDRPPEVATAVAAAGAGVAGGGDGQGTAVDGGGGEEGGAEAAAWNSREAQEARLVRWP